MKRGPKPSGYQGEVGEELVKSTYKLQKTLKKILQAIAIEQGCDQSDLVRDALIEYLHNRNIDPTKPPQITTSPLSSSASAI